VIDRATYGLVVSLETRLRRFTDTKNVLQQPNARSRTIAVGYQLKSHSAFPFVAGSINPPHRLAAAGA